MRFRTAPRAAASGFTLVEVLVALFAMALLAGFAWQALEGVIRSRDAGRDSIDRTVKLSTVLTQWEQDLRAVHDSGATPSALSFDGQTLRLTRRAERAGANGMESGVALVAWSVRGGQWQRWSSPVYVRVSQLSEAWLRSLQLLGNEPEQLTVANDASEWQVFFHRGNSWTNAQSTGDVQGAVTQPNSGVPAGPARELLPNAVRLVVTLNGQRLTRDVALGPNGG